MTATVGNRTTWITCEACPNTSDYGYGVGEYDQAVEAWCNDGGLSSVDGERHLCPTCSVAVRLWAEEPA